MVSPEVANIVGSITYPQEIDLAELAATFETLDTVSSVIYEPADNHWLQTRFVPDETYVAFYRSGRCSIAGCHSVDHLHEVGGRVNEVMTDLLEWGNEPPIEVSNIVATVDLGNPIQLEHLAIQLGLEAVEYEPEQFPALVYRHPEAVVLVFSSGKLVITGLTDLDVVSAVLSDLEPALGVPSL